MQYDLVIVGGGLGGMTLGMALAQHGARVLILEREAVYRDRVRGEGIFPWGAAEAKALGVYDPLAARCGCEIRWWTRHAGPGQAMTRDLPATTPSGLGCLNFYHAEMQEVLAERAQEAGAELRRPAEVVEVVPGTPPCVMVRENGSVRRIEARLVVGADGRASRVRNWGGFEVRHDPDCLVISSTLHERVIVPQDAIQAIGNVKLGCTVLIYPVGSARFRTYFIHRATDRPQRLSGSRDADAFVAACVATGVSPEWYGHARQIGPLASFDGATRWVEHPYRNGVVLIGDAAGASDPSFGAGLSLTLRDVRVLRDHLLAEPDWSAAAHAYAEVHDQHFGTMHRILGWLHEMQYAVGPAAEAVRARALPRMMDDPSRRPDIHGLGPNAPSDEAARKRYFGED